MQQETLRVPTPLQWRPQAIRGFPRRWRDAVERFRTTAERTDEELVGFLWNEYPGEPVVEIIGNTAADPARCFEITESLAAGVAAVVHSHPKGCAWPSEHDQAQQIATGVAWVIVPRGADSFAWGGLVQPDHLIIRPWRWGITDCWGAVRDGLRSLYGISVSSYPRAWQFWREGVEGALFERRIRAEGFEIVSEDLRDATETDVLLFRVHSQVFNHAALVVGDGLMYHHPSSPRPFDPTISARVETLDRYARIPCGVARRVA